MSGKKKSSSSAPSESKNASRLNPETSPFVIIPVGPTGLGKPPLARQPSNVPASILQRIDHSEITWAVSTLNDNIRRVFSRLDKKRYTLHTRGALPSIIFEIIFAAAIAGLSYYIGLYIAMSWVAWVIGAFFILMSFFPGIKAARVNAQNRRAESGTICDNPWLYKLLEQGCTRMTARFAKAGVVFILPTNDPVFSCNAPGRKIGVDSPFFRAFVVVQIDPEAAHGASANEADAAVSAPMMMDIMPHAAAAGAVSQLTAAPPAPLPGEHHMRLAAAPAPLPAGQTGTLRHISSLIDYSNVPGGANAGRGQRYMLPPPPMSNPVTTAVPGNALMFY